MEYKAQLLKLTEQLVDLQSQFAFHEDTVSALNEVIATQQQEIITLRRQMTLLKQRQDEVQSQLDQGDGPVEERPPHY